MFVELWRDSASKQPGPAEPGTPSGEMPGAGLLAEEMLAWELLSEAEERAWAAAVIEFEPGDPLEMPPGWPLAIHLDAVDQDALTGTGLVAALRAHARLVAHHQAHLSRLVMAVSDRLGGLDGIDPDDVARATVAELRAALHLTRRAAEAELDLAISLCHRLPGVLDALETGVIDLRRARVLIDVTSHLTIAMARQVCAQALEHASRMTTGQLTAHLRRLCLQTDPDHAQARYEHALEGRAVVAEQTADGTVTITASDLPAERAAAVMERLTRIAKSLKTSDEERSLDQLRADVLVDLLDGTATFDHTRGSVDIRVDLATLLQLNDDPAALGGYGPVVADIARKVMKTRHKAQWSYTVTDDNGAAVETGTTSRRPTAATRRTVTRRDTTCIFPGCRAPATACDLDHREPHRDGGSAAADNLAPLCRADHTLRHSAGWSHTPNDDGTHTWRSPLGTSYTTEHPP
ncbi:MAG: DUF222 domain-containing protein [Acidimicrobiia bacterium]